MEKNKKRKYILMLFIYFFGLFFISVSLWTQKYFGIVSIDQVISTIVFGYDGVFDADSIYIKRFIKWCLIGPVVATSILFFLKIFIFRKEKFIKPTSFFLNKLNHPAIIFLMGLFLLMHQFSILNYFKNIFLFKKDYFSLNYIDPKLVQLTQTHPKNLVIIYVESLESTYSNENIFGHDLLWPLNQLKKENNTISFSQYKQMPGTGWTIAGIVATQCGIPLKQFTIFNGNRMGENMNHFLPNAVCLSDILSKFGYKNIFMNGSSTKVGGKFKFFYDHHYNEIYGKEEWLKEGIKQSTMEGWGLSDHDLFEQAKIILSKKISENKPFNLTILTVDTHGYSGQLNEYCKKQNYHGFDGIVECTAREVSDFILYIKHHGWLDKMNVVVLGDHLAMQNSMSNKLNSEKNRYVYNLFIGENTQNKNTNEMMTFSLFPTILEFIGFHFKDDKMGLGYSGISARKNLQPVTYIADTENNIGSFSEAYAKLWLQKGA